MAFISELNFLGGGGGEFVEITLGPNDDPNDFVVSAYDENGFLYAASGITGGQISLGSLVGVPSPVDPDFTIYEIPVGIRDSVSDTNEGSAIALTDISAGGAGVIDFYSASSLPPIIAVNGAAFGFPSENNLNFRALASGESYQWDIFGNLTLAPITSGTSILCLTSTAQIKTKSGLVACGDLRVGDLVWTADNGFQPLRWIGVSAMTARDFARNPKIRPVRISAGALAAGVPDADLVVSPQHRVLVRSVVARRMYDQSEILVSARGLQDIDGVNTQTADHDITYIHLLFDHHEIISANGGLVESLLIADESSLILKAREFVDATGALLPQDLRGCATRPCRHLARGRKARNLIARLKSNGKAVQEHLTTLAD